MGVASGCGYQEVGVASGSGWNLWVWLVGGMYGCGYQEVGVVGRRRVWLAGGIYGCGYQEVGVVAQVKSMDDNCGEWVECMGVASGWTLWVWLSYLNVLLSP